MWSRLEHLFQRQSILKTWSDRRGVLLASPPSSPPLQSLVSPSSLPPSDPSPPCSLRAATSLASPVMSQTPPPGPGQGDERMNTFFSRRANRPVPVFHMADLLHWAGGVSPSGPAWLKMSARACGSNGFTAERTSKAWVWMWAKPPGLLPEAGWGFTECSPVPSQGCTARPGGCSSVGP